MPPRASLTSSFSVSDASNEVVCPLRNQDGSNCRKRCFGEKRYRSMQEHIRRAHPEHYISKLPATEESFNLMVNTPPSEHPRPQTGSSAPGHGFDPNPFYGQDVSPTDQHNRVQYNQERRGSILPTASAAAALAQLHNSRPENDWENEQRAFADPDGESHYLHNFFASDGAHEIFQDNNHHHNINDTSPPMSRDLMAPGLNRTPSYRASSLQPFPRTKQRPRKSSVSENARKAKHERERSKDQKRLSADRKALSAEPSAAAGLSSKRWEDLLDAAASATEEDSRDLTPIPQSPRSSMPPFPGSAQQNQFQSYTASPLQNSILPQSPEPNTSFSPNLEPFPSVESAFVEAHSQSSQQPYHSHNHSHSHHHQNSGDSGTSNPYASQFPRHHHQSSTGSNFHIADSGLSSSPQDIQTASAIAHIRQLHQSSSYAHPNPVTGGVHGNAAHAHSNSTGNTAPGGPSYNAGAQQAATPPVVVQHYCAACRRIAQLSNSYACTECICGICRDCVDVLVGMGPERGARCPRCGAVEGRFKPFMLDLR